MLYLWWVLNRRLMRMQSLRSSKLCDSCQRLHAAIFLLRFLICACAALGSFLRFPLVTVRRTGALLQLQLLGFLPNADWRMIRLCISALKVRLRRWTRFYTRGWNINFALLATLFHSRNIWFDMPVVQISVLWSCLVWSCLVWSFGCAGRCAIQSIAFNFMSATAGEYILGIFISEKDAFNTISDYPWHFAYCM